MADWTRLRDYQVNQMHYYNVIRQNGSIVTFPMGTTPLGQMSGNVITTRNFGHGYRRIDVHDHGTGASNQLYNSDWREPWLNPVKGVTTYGF